MKILDECANILEGMCSIGFSENYTKTHNKTTPPAPKILNLPT
jgi:hypothetical protein